MYNKKNNMCRPASKGIGSVLIITIVLLPVIVPACIIADLHKNHKENKEIKKERKKAKKARKEAQKAQKNY